jgi:hypothetical protein
VRGRLLAHPGHTYTLIGTDRMPDLKYTEPNVVRVEIEHLLKLRKLMSDPSVLAEIDSLIGELERHIKRLEGERGTPG